MAHRQAPATTQSPCGTADVVPEAPPVPVIAQALTGYIDRSAMSGRRAGCPVDRRPTTSTVLVVLRDPVA